PTVAGLATRLEAALLREHGVASPVLPVKREQPLPLSYAQQRLWFLDQLETGSVAYNVPAAVRLEGALDVSALAGALSEVVRRHEALRTHFAINSGQPVQVIEEPEPVTLPITDLGGLAAPEREDEVRRLLSAEACRPF